MALPPLFAARLVAASMLSPRVRQLVFAREDGLPFAFEAGQWVELLLPLDEDTTIRKAYSVASLPDGSPHFECAVTRVDGGEGSTYLHTLPVGTVIQVQGPQGFFTRPVPGAPSLLVGNGTGVTPLRSMLRAALAAGDSAPLWLLFGTRYEEDLLYCREFQAFAARYPCFRVFFTLSKPHAGWKGEQGYVQAHVPTLWQELCALSPEPHAYICGLDKMVGVVRTLLRQELHVPRHQVHTERYDTVPRALPAPAPPASHGDALCL